MVWILIESLTLIVSVVEEDDAKGVLLLNIR